MQTAAIAHRVADFLAQHPPFHCMEQPDLLALVARGRVKFHEVDEYLCWQDAAFAPLLFVIQQGSVSLWDERASQLLDIRGPGDIIGLERFLDAAAYPYSAKANCDVVIYALPAAEFQPLLERYPPAARYVAAQAAAGAIYREAGRSGVHETYVGEWSRETDAPECAPEDTVADAARLLHTTAADYLAVRRGPQLLGVVGAAEIVAWVAQHGDSRAPVERLMRPVPAALPPDTLVADGVLTMTRHDPPVAALTVGGSLVTPAVLRPAFGDDPIALLHQTAKAGGVEALGRLHRRARAFLQAQLTSPATVDWLGAFSERFNAALAGRLLELRGVDPRAGVWCFFGAAGRQELLTPVAPQLALIGAEASAALATLQADLEACGYLPSPRLNVATWGSLENWRGRFTRWIQDPILGRAYEARPLFDLRPAFGDRAHWEPLAALVREEIAVAPEFRQLLANDSLAALPPLTFFEDAVVDLDGERRDTFELEERALAPLVDVGRVFGIADGRALGASTLDRLNQARARRPAHEATFREAAETLRVLLYLQARAGLRHHNDGAQVPPAALSRYDRQALKSGFRAIHSLLVFATQELFWEEPSA